MYNLHHLLHLQVKEHPPKPYAPFANHADRVSGSRGFLIFSVIVFFYTTTHIQHVFETIPLPKCSQEVSDHIMVSLKSRLCYYCFLQSFFHLLGRHPSFVLYVYLIDYVGLHQSHPFHRYTALTSQCVAYIIPQPYSDAFKSVMD